MHGRVPANLGSEPNVQMEQNAYQEIPGLPSPSSKDHSPYIESIVMAAEWLKKHRGADSPIGDQKADLTIYVSFLITETEKWTDKFRDSQRNAARFYRDKDTYFRTIAIGVSTPQTEKVCLEIFPNLDRGKYFPHDIPAPTPEKINPRGIPAPQPRIQEAPEETEPRLGLVKKPFSLNIATRLCRDWRLDTRWEKLFPCSRELFCRLIFRTYRKDTIRKIKKAIARGETYFPWCLTGNDSLSRQLTYHPKSSCRMKHYERRQIGRALRQLWNLGFIHRIFRGYEDQGAGKYHVFLNPKMSARFNKSSIEVKGGSTRKKRISRMS